MRRTAMWNRVCPILGLRQTAGAKYIVMTNIHFSSADAQCWQRERKEYVIHHPGALILFYRMIATPQRILEYPRGTIQAGRDDALFA
jgi:hypothetical protein